MFLFLKSPTSIVYLIFGIAYMILAGFFLSYTFDLQNNGIQTTGVVIENFQRMLHDSYMYYPVIEFRDGETYYKFNGTDGSDTVKYQLGETVKIIYLKDHPYEAKINSFWVIWFDNLMLCFLSGAALMFSLYGFLSKPSPYKDEHPPLRS